MNASNTLVSFDRWDTQSVSAALFERIVEATNSTALANKWFLAGDKGEVKTAIAEAGERAAQEFARDFAPPDFVAERIIRYVLPLPNREWLATPVDEIEFRVHIDGLAYERLIAAICSQRGF